MTREEIDEGEELLFQTSFHLNLYASGLESWESRVISCIRACLCRQRRFFHREADCDERHSNLTKEDGHY